MYFLSFLLISAVLFNILFGNNHSLYTTGRYTIHANRCFKFPSMSSMTVGTETECLLQCSKISRCRSLNVMEGTMENDGKIECHLFNVTHNSMAMSLDENDLVDHYKTENFEDCSEAKRERTTTGVYGFRHRNGFQFEAFCDMEIDTRGWTVIQKRFNGSVDFARPWVDYKNGFGDVNGEYWLGLDAIHELTKNKNSTLRVDMWDNSDYAYAVYSHVKISDENEGFRLNYEAMIDGTTVASDSLGLSNGMMFSTFDRDNDTMLGVSCSNRHSNAGWWFNGCAEANPNGAYTPGVTHARNGVYWESFRGFNHSIEEIEMKLE